MENGAVNGTTGVCTSNLKTNIHKATEKRIGKFEPKNSGIIFLNERNPNPREQF